VAERDWVRIVAEERCDECGLAPAEVAGPDLAAGLRHEAERWAVLLETAAPDALRARSGGTWSALEYAAHTRDTLAVFAGRVGRMLAEDDPELGWWDHEAAVAAERYNEQDPTDVGLVLVANAEALALALEAVEGDAWGRTGVRRAGERFTVEGLGRFALHEAAHHRRDAEVATRRA